MRSNDVIEANLKRYLEAEASLDDFFSVFDYCLSRCVAIALEKNGNRPVAACCTRKYYTLYDLDHPAFVRLRKEREQLYGRPQDYHWPDPVSACQYHDPYRGCVLKTHKSPICIAFLCRPAIDCLREEFGIYDYDYLGFYYALEWILTGDLADGQYLELTESIRAMTRTVRARTVASRKRGDPVRRRAQGVNPRWV
jgi:hypothetical protein